MQGSAPDRLSKLPGFDPLRAELIADRANLPTVPAEQLTVDALRNRFASPPDWSPEFKGDLYTYRNGEMRPAAVLVPIVRRAVGLTVLLTERTAHLSSHAGQIAFPGGRVDDDDSSVVATALREAYEEVGLESRLVEVLGTLPQYLTGTGYRVTPVVALVEPTFQLQLQQDEVAEAFEVPMSFLMNPVHHQRRVWRWEQGVREFYAMPFRPTSESRDYFIWGATAAMLRNLYWFLAAPQD